jgi:LynF/TruF/PatF family peptide O-prenyltransferase
MNSIIQTRLLSDQRLYFIKAHLQAFEVDPSVYPLKIFEDFIAKLDDDCVFSIEASCKIEADKLLAGRFLVFLRPPFESSLAQTLKFYNQVESLVGVQINLDLFQKFLGKSFDFSKVFRSTLGIDLRENLADSSLKMHIMLNDYPEKIETALALDGNCDLDKFPWIDMQKVNLVGFDFYLDGRTKIEVYAALAEEQFRQSQIRALLEQSFSPAVVKPLEVSTMFYVGLSKANENPVLYYSLKDKKDLLNYFAINDTAHKVNAFYQGQEVIPEMWVGVAQQELVNSRIENIRLYYYYSTILLP